MVSSEPTICLAISRWSFATLSRDDGMQGILWSVLMMAMMIMMKIHMVMAMMEMPETGNGDDEDGNAW